MGVICQISRLEELFVEAGFPAGVVNIVTGAGQMAGTALAAHPGVDKIAIRGAANAIFFNQGQICCAGSRLYVEQAVFDAAMPFGGYKQSGWGREMGHEVLENYTEVKSVCIKL